jgi:hypothetical protein
MRLWTSPAKDSLQRRQRRGSAVASLWLPAEVARDLVTFTLRDDCQNPEN